MSAPPPSGKPAEGSPDGPVRDFVRSAEATQEISGHHNRNHVVLLTDDVARLLDRQPGSRVTVRIRRARALSVVIRTWPEDTILDAIRTLPHVPRCLYRGEGFAIHSYVDGVPLSSVCPNGKPVDARLVKALAGLLAEPMRVPRHALPPLPDAWPAGHRDSQGFLRTLTRLAERQIRLPNWPAHGDLFAALGVPEDALPRLAERVPAMTPRPYSLLHGDLHRDNLILSYGTDPPLICVDWELATYGDPLHDLATHLVRMRYPAHQWAEVIDAWAEAMGAACPDAVAGLGKDLRHYVDFERAQSVYPDVIRAAGSLPDAVDQRSLDLATAEVHRALTAAAEPLRLTRVPDETEIERILFRRRESRSRRRPAGVDWHRDYRVPEHPGFPEATVQRVLLAEAAGRWGSVFEGTSHLSTVVRLPDVPVPVVVRRRRDLSRDPEYRYLNEHAVLRVIEESGANVRAPRLLALGFSDLGGQFAVHTYEGSSEGASAGNDSPRHPVGGLLPHEADDLVDQLRALTLVDFRMLDPSADMVGFHHWLVDDLVRTVQRMPKDGQQLALHLGLPDATRLPQLLHRHSMSERAPALLHRDLNPWNLVRAENGGQLAIIDWEKAIVGDPLYDLVRHFHLTPTRPEIRERIFRRWERALPATSTHGWRQDWRHYRQIEIVRSAYVDLDRLLIRDRVDTPDVRHAVDDYAFTLRAALAAVGLPYRTTANPLLTRALPRAERRGYGAKGAGVSL